MKTKFKKIFLVAFLIGVAVTSTSAQIVNNDTISKLTGERIAVKIINTGDNSVTFSYPGETMTNTISKNLIKEIKYSSGRIEKVSEIIVINGEKDWEKVVLTEQPSDIDGLVKKGDISKSSANLGFVYTPVKKSEEKLHMQIKKEAAKLGAHVVLISPMIVSTSFMLKGTAYGYK